MRLQLPCLRTSRPPPHRLVHRSASTGVLQSRRSGTSRGSRGPPRVHRCLLSAYANRYPVSHVPIVELGMWQTSRCSIPYALIVGEHPDLLQAYDVVLGIRERCSNRIDALPPILAHELEPPAVEREHAQLAVRVRHLCTSTRVEARAHVPALLLSSPIITAQAPNSIMSAPLPPSGPFSRSECVS